MNRKDSAVIGLVNERVRMHACHMATHEATPVTMGRVVGENVRHLRESHQLTQAELARKLQAFGLRWTRSNIAALEAGNRDSVDLGIVLLLALALNSPIEELFAGDGLVQLGFEVSTRRQDCRALFSSSPDLRVDLVFSGGASERRDRAIRDHNVEMPRDTRFIDVMPVQADNELAERLGVMPAEVTDAAHGLWGLTLHQERDRRIGMLGHMPANERRARRGHLTRELAREIESALAAKSRRRTRREK